MSCILTRQCGCCIEYDASVDTVSCGEKGACIIDDILNRAIHTQDVHAGWLEHGCGRLHIRKNGPVVRAVGDIVFVVQICRPESVIEIAFHVDPRTGVCRFDVDWWPVQRLVPGLIVIVYDIRGFRVPRSGTGHHCRGFPVVGVVVNHFDVGDIFRELRES